MRYKDNKRVEDVREHLRGIGVETSAQNFHDFLRRVLYLLPHAEALRLRVDVALLRAVRVRLKIPTDPKGVRMVVGRTTRRHDSRRRRRRLQVGRKPKPPAPPPALPRAPRRERVDDSGQLPLGITPVPPTSPELTPLQGSEADPKTLTRQDWQVLNRRARLKLRVDRKVLPNYQGTVIHLATRDTFTAQELIERYGLTPAEAQSCFQTFTKPRRY